MKNITALAVGGLIAAAAIVVFVPSYTGTPRKSTELGFPQQVLFELPAARAAYNKPPQPLPPVTASGQTASAVYRNVQVLGDVDAGEFMRLQTAMTQWVAPKQGCAFCHDTRDYAADNKPQKIAARLMLQMTRHLNTDWANHVQPAGVTCYTCHRGEPVPREIWFPLSPMPQRPNIGKAEDWGVAADTVRKFFPDDSYAEYLFDDNPIAVQSTTVEPTGRTGAKIVAKRVYEMMMTMSDGIGVNCGYCHNSRSFADWKESTPNRWVAFDAIRLVRDLNRNYLTKLAAALPLDSTLIGETGIPVLPPRYAGVRDGNGFVLCATCHNGIPKPLGGAAMLRDYPGLGGPAAPHS